MIFLLIAIYSSAVRLQTTNWTDHLGRAQWFVLIALPLGYLLGKSRFRWQVSLIFGAVYTLFFVPWLLAGLIQAELWWERLASYAGRLSRAMSDLLANRPVNDSLLILTFLCLLYWLASLIAGFQLTRNGRPWVGVITAGVIVLIVDYSFEMYAAPDTGTALSLMYFLFTLILIGRLFYLASSKEWASLGGMVENEVGFDISRTAAIAALVVVLLSWLSPRAVKAFTPGSQESQQLSQQYQDLRDRVSKAVSSLNSQAPIFVESLGDSLALGTGSNLSDEIVLTVKPENGRLTTGRFYWTGRIYDTFINNQWVSTETKSSPFGLGASQIPLPWQGRTEVSVEISSRISLLRTLYFPDVPITVTRAVQAELGPAAADFQDITALVSDPPLSAGEVYSVRASISTPTIEQLRDSAPNPYPDWVIARYTQLPPNFSERVAALATAIAADQATPYDKTIAVTNWLRSNITYQTTIPTIPAGTDPIEWFLFDAKVGFCNYYATSEVLMLRSLGIPARINVGYAEGTWSPEESNYQVSGKEYHAWPEVFFPGIGWVPFEPTVSQPLLDYPATSSSGSSSSSGIPGGVPTPFVPPSSGSGEIDAAALARAQAELQREQNTRNILIGVFVAAIALLVYAIRRWARYTLKGMPVPTWVEKTLAKRGLRTPGWLVNWSIRAQRSPMESLFANVGEMLRVWGQPPELDLTPSEQVRRLGSIVPDLSRDANLLLQEYQYAIYSRHDVNILRARQAATSLRQKGYQLWFQRLLRINP